MHTATLLSGRCCLRLLSLLFCLALLTACAGRQPGPSAAAPEGEIRDLRNLPQDLSVYANRAGAERPLLSSAQQQEANRRYDRLFFNPWRSPRASIKAKDAFAVFGRGPRGYAENLLPWQSERWTELETNANAAGYPSRADQALTVTETSLREVPTQLPRFAHPTDPGQGFPFDLFQYSSLPPGMPVLITHASRDGAWVFVENALVGGWLPSRDVALADAAVRQRYETGQYAAILRNGVPLRDGAGRFVTLANLGAVLPVVSSGRDGSLVLPAPVRDAQGEARLVPVRVSASDAAIKPLPVTPGGLARIGNPMLNQPYGWGGLFGNRDCSSTLRDLFAPFGIWLPRNSAAQAKAWDYRAFGDVSAPAKEEMILAEGVPFGTLLWLRGHIALYLGKYNGRAVMFHNIWGIRTVEPGVPGGRHILGRAVITSTRPGVELPNVQDREGLLNRMLGMSVLRQDR